MKNPIAQWLRRRNPGILLDWDAIRVRQYELNDLAPSMLSAVDQAQATIRDFLHMTGIDESDQRDLYCVAVGIALTDATARNLFDTPHLPTSLVADVAMSGVIPMIEDAKETL